jgi:hypothetical protein
MSTPNPKPVTKKLLNPKLLPIAALLLVVLALLFMVTPLLRMTGGTQRTGNFPTQGANGQTFQPGNFNAQGGTTGRTFTGQGGAAGRTFPGQTGSTLPVRRIGLIGGRVGPIIYFFALLAALAAAIGMFLVKRWGQILGIVMAVLYGLLGLLSLLPLLLLRTFGFRSPLGLILGIAEFLLAVAVIVLAVLPVKQAAPAKA